MKKKDFKLIGEFVDKGNPKDELNFALLRDGGFVATDTRRLIDFRLHDFKCDPILVHKKVLKLVEGFVGKDDIVKVSSVGSVENGSVSISLSSANLDAFDKGEFKYPDTQKLLDVELPQHFKLDKLNDIVFELSQQNCFIEGSMLYPLIEHGDADWYEVFYKPQNGTDSGMVKIIAMQVIDDAELVTYTAVVMGRTFDSQAKGF